MRDINDAPGVDTRTAVEVMEDAELLLEQKRKQHEKAVSEYHRKILELRREFEEIENSLLIEISELERVRNPLKRFGDNIRNLIEAVRDHDMSDAMMGAVGALFDDTKPFVLPEGSDFSLDEKKKREIITSVLAQTGFTKDEAYRLLGEGSQTSKRKPTITTI